MSWELAGFSETHQDRRTPDPPNPSWRDRLPREIEARAVTRPLRNRELAVAGSGSAALGHFVFQLDVESVRFCMTRSGVVFKQDNHSLHGKPSY